MNFLGDIASCTVVIKIQIIPVRVTLMQPFLVRLSEMHHINVHFVNRLDITLPWVHSDWSCSVDTSHIDSKEIRKNS